MAQTNFERLEENRMIVGTPTQAFIDEVNQLDTAEVDAMIAVNQTLLTSPERGRVQVGQCDNSGLPAGGF